MSSRSTSTRSTSTRSSSKSSSKPTSSKPTSSKSTSPPPVLQSKGIDPEQEKLLLEPFAYLTLNPGKDIRKKLLHAFNHWMKIPDSKVEEIGNVVQMLHHSSLLIDDIQDNSVLRRGLPVAHKIYGEASTINCANYVMFIALEKILEIGHPEAVNVFSKQLLELHRGQGMEIYWRDSFKCPTEEEYRQMTIRKTGGLFNLAIELMDLFSSTKNGFVNLSGLLGLYFQIRDDYVNLCSKDYAKNKSFAEDLTEGKFSFPLIHAIREDPADNKILNILRQRTHEVAVKNYCVDLLKKAGSFDYTKKVLKALDAEARTEIEKLGGNKDLIKLLDDLKNWERED